MKIRLFFLFVWMGFFLGPNGQLLGWSTSSSSHIFVQEKETGVQPGKETIELHLQNQSETVDQKPIVCRWEMRSISKMIEQGSIQLNFASKKRMEIAIRLSIPPEITDNDYIISLTFSQDGISFTPPQNIRLRTKDWKKDLVMRLRDLQYDPQWIITADIEDIKAIHHAFTFHTSFIPLQQQQPGSCTPKTAQCASSQKDHFSQKV